MTHREDVLPDGTIITLPHKHHPLRWDVDTRTMTIVLPVGTDIQVYEYD